MTKFIQILLLVVVVLSSEANGTPFFQGISFQRGFEINFKPLPRKPIAFIKEKWSPFGVFGRRHSIQKRSPGVPGPEAPVVPIGPVPQEPQLAAPVFEHVDEINHLQTAPLKVLPPQPSRPVVPLLPVSPIPPEPVSELPSPVISANIVNIPPNKPVTNIEPLPGSPVPIQVDNPPISSNLVVPPPEIEKSNAPPPPGLFTDISRAEPVREFIQSVPPPLGQQEKVAPPLETNSIRPEVPRNDVVINENSLVRGSKVALYFGSIFLQLMSQFLSNARATFDQMTNPPPVYNN